jgi:hypothetical protein
MHKYVLLHLSDDAALSGLDRLLRAEYPHEAQVLAHVAVVDARQLYRAAGYPSTADFLMGRWHLCRSSAFRRQRAARAALRFPALFESVAEGRLNLTALALLARHFTADNVEELIAAATHRSCEEVEQLIADRFPEADLPFRLNALPDQLPSASVPVAIAANSAPAEAGASQVLANQEASVPLEALAASTAAAMPPHLPARAVVRPTAPERYVLQVMISGAARGQLRRAQELLGFQVRANDVAQVLELALDALVEKLEKHKCARTDRPRRVAPPQSQNPRQVPAHVKRAVRERDGDQCAFRNAAGQRCPERKALELHHVLDVARGGRSTVENLELRCRPHNQLAAERTYGSEFMNYKRVAAAQRRIRE